MVCAMEEKCEGCDDGGCRTSEEEIYWTHFRNLQFFVVFGKNFLKQLILPRKFARNVSTKIPSRVFLQSPTGAKWEVNLKVNGDEMCFLEGWEDFAKAFRLQENDILHFVYSRGSCFDVHVFDGEDLCEKASCYFIWNCGHKKSEKKRDIGDITSDADDSELIPVKRTRKDRGGEIVENLNGNGRTLSKENEKDRGKDPIRDNLRPRKDTGGDAVEKSATHIGSGGAPSNKEHVKDGRNTPMADNLRPTKEPGVVQLSNLGFPPPPPHKTIGRPRSSLPPNSSGKSDISRAENGRAENLRKSASTPRKKPGFTGNTSGRSLAQQVSKRPIRRWKPAPTNSSLEVTAGSGVDVISSDNEGSDQLSASSMEQSAEDEQYTGRTMKATPKKIITQKDGACQTAVLPNGVQP
ncbi:B3 domain-containing protein [Drosera capensis]